MSADEKHPIETIVVTETDRDIRIKMHLRYVNVVTARAYAGGEISEEEALLEAIAALTEKLKSLR